MRRILHLVPALCLAGTLLTACNSPGSTVTYTTYQLTCCSKADIDRVWQPGSTVELHWAVTTSTTTGLNPIHKVVIAAVLMGPFSDVNTLKHAAGATHAVQGSIITMDASVPPPPDEVTTFVLPADLPPGYYQLNLNWDFGGGNSQGAGGIVQVGAQ